MWAQVTIVREDFAHECNILRLVDKRFASKMVGVGSADSLGRVHGVSEWLPGPQSILDAAVLFHCKEAASVRCHCVELLQAKVPLLQ
jgi:hypothetical protein